MSFDRVVISANESWLYIDFWPLVAYAWKTIFPECKPTLAFLTEREEGDEFVGQLRKHGEVVLVRPVRNITQAAQAKMARYYVASKFTTDVCMIEDIDSIPIDREWHLHRTNLRKRCTVLLVGAEVYEKELPGQAPVSTMTAEGMVFDQLFGVGKLSFAAWLDTMKRGGVGHDNIESPAYNEAIECSTSAAKLKQAMFSDEGLITKLIKEKETLVTHVRRDYVVGRDTIDRSCLALFTAENLEAGRYVTAHTGRPYAEFKAINDQIIDYIRRRYAGKPAQLRLTHTPKLDLDMKFESARELGIYNSICKAYKPGHLIVQYGSNHTLTNYLSRYYWVVAIERQLEAVNIYPAHYILERVGETIDLGSPRILKRLAAGCAIIHPDPAPVVKPQLAIVKEGPTEAASPASPAAALEPSKITPVATNPARRITLSEDKHGFLPKAHGNASHLPLLLLALKTTNDDALKRVAEYGMGTGSTKLLHDYCGEHKRELCSFENNGGYAAEFKYMENSTHKLRTVDWKNGIGHGEDWSVVLIDHAPPEQRHKEIMALKDRARIIVVHDSEERSPGYMLKKIFPMFKSRCDLNLPKPWASAVALSNFIDLSSWRGISFEGYPYSVE